MAEAKIKGNKKFITSLPRRGQAHLRLLQAFELREYRPSICLAVLLLFRGQHHGLQKLSVPALKKKAIVVEVVELALPQFYRFVVGRL